MEIKGLVDTTKFKAILALSAQIKKEQPELSNKEAFDLAVKQLA